ncbi:DUF551 domain-containing protein [Enterobacter asburiae]|uniref:DUF551 domain-containing protein n=1 Tax=Enterobacter asburiae TaxID=61645 RepID=UPI003BBCBD54
MITITKERVAGIASGEKCYTHDDVVELARIALASLEAKPVAAAYVINGVIEADDFASYCGHPKFQDGPIELYANPPAPVSVPDEVLKRLLPDAEKAEFWFEHDGKILFEGVKFNNAVFEACRAAMLQGAEPVTTAYKFPANASCKDAPEHIWLQTAGVWPENGEFSELTWCSDNQHPDDTLYVRADVVAGRSPVVPDGWVMVPAEPTAKQWAAGMQAFDSGMDKVTRVYKAMLAAAPQQEVK